ALPQTACVLRTDASVRRDFRSRRRTEVMRCTNEVPTITGV
ncbi:MAG: hypothetical protein AVDCRST_MAG60-2263, partial [uncultured Nocardioides sp.]